MPKIRVTGIALGAWLTLAGIVCAALVAPLFVTGWNPRVFQVVANDPLLPKIQLWLTTIIAQAVLWVVCVAYLVETSARITRTTSNAGRNMRAAALALLPLFLMLVLFGLKQSLVHAPIPPSTLGGVDITNLPKFAGFGALVAAWAVWEMYVVRSIWQFESSAENKDGATVVRYIELREEVLRLLMMAGVVLALGTLASAALRNAVNGEWGGEYFPQEYIVMYGGIYSLLLLLAYIPVYTTFYASAVVIRNRLCGDAPETAEEFKSWNEARDALSEKLGLTLTGASALGPPLSALLPVVSGWVVNILQAKK